MADGNERAKGIRLLCKSRVVVEAWSVVPMGELGEGVRIDPGGELTGWGIVR